MALTDTGKADEWMNESTDDQLLDACSTGDRIAFEQLVRRYQTLVCSVAYSIVGDRAASEDIGQETFLIAWHQLQTLRDRSRLKSWLATIARNQAKQWLRRLPPSMQELTTETTVTFSKNKLTQAVDQTGRDDEELDLVWTTLERLPESFREPLVLFYRQEQSVAEVAEALQLSPAAVKQRLSRGRQMLRQEVNAAIERALRQSAPKGAFTVAVMSLLASGKTATATGIGTSAFATTKLSSTATAIGYGTASAASGTAFGIAGGLLGSWIGWATAEYQSQRQLIVRQSLVYGLGLCLFSLPFAAMQLGWKPYLTLGKNGYGLALAGWMLFFMTCNCTWIFWVMRAHQRLQLQERNAETPTLPTHQKIQTVASRWEGRRWSSKTLVMGLPLIDIAFADPMPSTKSAGIGKTTAHGWIAIGDRAHGRIIALGNLAIGPIAIGTFAAGILSFGVCSVGVVSIGVISLAVIVGGIIAVGGFSTAVVALGVVAVGVMTAGAYAAKGVVAVAGKYAAGETAIAPEANTEAAISFFQSTVSITTAESLLRSSASIAPGPLASTALLLVLLPVMFALAFRRKRAVVR
ncbi:sigma-70 family RNA polymerase sigma factor [Stieleria sp. TO1_6]|uniref:RNA polymerase sigma factor n=1 Tax=Stieleria tagensis TaxID=2956795 RepID=UPI00209ADE95|nr:sigma-70 family RNA polymerase sigma factor [Stieleria tagensis]MCO8123145.1 sigma-70 family RNA polymerase sigma factor [Stieleria tagensis]